MRGRGRPLTRRQAAQAAQAAVLGGAATLAALEGRPAHASCQGGAAEPADRGGAGTALPWIDSCADGAVGEGAQADAREDFYLSVNGPWLQNVRVEDGEASVGARSVIQREVAAQLAHALDSGRPGFHEGRQAQDFYLRLLDDGSRERDGASPLLPYLAGVEGAAGLEDLEGRELTRGLARLCRLEAAPGPDGRLWLAARPPQSLRDLGARPARAPFVLGGPGGGALSQGVWQAGRPGLAGYGARGTLARRRLAAKLLGMCGYGEEEADGMADEAFALDAWLFRASPGRASRPVFLGREELGAASGAFPLVELADEALGAPVRGALVADPGWLSRLGAAFRKENAPRLRAWLLCATVLAATPFGDASLARGLLDSACAQAAEEAYDACGGGLALPGVQEAALLGADGLFPMALGRLYAETFCSNGTRALAERLVWDTADALRELVGRACPQAGRRDCAQAAQACPQACAQAAQTTPQVGQAAERLASLEARCCFPDSWEAWSLPGLDLGRGLAAENLVEAYIERMERARADCLASVGAAASASAWRLAPYAACVTYDGRENALYVCAGALNGALYQEGWAEEDLLGGAGALVGAELSRGLGLGRAIAGARPGADELVGLACALRLAGARGAEDLSALFSRHAKARRFKAASGRDPAEEAGLPLSPCMAENLAVREFDEFHNATGTRPGDGMWLAPELRLSASLSR